MRGPSYRRFTIAANTPKLEVDNRFPLKKYYRAADNLLKQAQIYREEKNLIELYVLLLRFSSLVGETIPKHRDFRAYPSKEKAVYTQKFVQILSELEKLKPEVQRQVDLLNKEIENSISSDVIKDEQTYEWPPVSKSLVHSNFGARKLEIEKWKSQGNTTEHIEHLDNFSLKFPPPNKETLSRHSLLGPDGLRPRWKPPVTLARVEYPSYGDPVADLARLDQEWSTTLASETSPDLTQSVTKLEGDACPIGFGNNFDVDVCSQPNLIKQPSPPPVSAPVHDIPVMDELMQLCKPDKSLPDSLKTTDPSPSPLSTLVKDLEASESPKKLHIVSLSISFAGCSFKSIIAFGMLQSSAFFLCFCFCFA
ncbi:hypothetical protein KP509_14G002000 [Ceratopteris richardii]|uniref:USP8 dimerisation domain-containing protein n=1 Tax=Ceratopteris richardii TaxID=49495 RepID=A0A8T2T8Y4_CERRI|nr:hypothetical protein KP509_14G002000 [Ceratopteris richardii]